METEKLHDLMERYYKSRDFITNEETAKMALVVPFLRSLGYDPNNPQEVRLEYRAEFTQSDGKRHADRMDYAIFDKAGVKPLMVIFLSLQCNEYEWGRTQFSSRALLSISRINWDITFLHSPSAMH